MAPARLRDLHFCQFMNDLSPATIDSIEPLEVMQCEWNYSDFGLVSCVWDKSHSAWPVNLVNHSEVFPTSRNVVKCQRNTKNSSLNTSSVQGLEQKYSGPMSQGGKEKSAALVC